MTKIVSVEEMRAIDKAADAAGLSFDQMMENAGRAVAEEILKRFPRPEGLRTAILVGYGNNGGDGLVAARYLHHLLQPIAFAFDHAKELLVAEADKDQRSRVLKNLIATSDILIDAVLGTGFKLPLRGQAKRVLGNVKKGIELRDSPIFVVAVDSPSGLDNDSGQVAEETLKADLTISMIAAKNGLLRFPGASKVGELIIADIGVSPKLKELKDVELELATRDTLASWLPERPRDAHKGTFGRVLAIAGSTNFPGAAGLAGLGAYLSGAGLVTMAVPAPVQALVAQSFPEATWILLPHELGVVAETAVEVLGEALEDATALLIGPGFGQEATTAAFLAKLLGAEEKGPRGRIGFISNGEAEASGRMKLPACVVDADALKLLTLIDEWHTSLPEASILTPHPGEMAILTGQEKEAIQEDRVGAARKWAKSWGHVVLLKGAFSVVSAPDGRSTVLPFATPALARAGTGDVLAGVVVGLLAQGVPAYEAAILGGFIHGRAGELAAELVGSSASVLAGDVADAVPLAITELAGAEF